MGNFAYEIQFLLSLAITIVIEIIVLWLAIRFLFRLVKEALGPGIIIFAGLIASLTTLPYVWFIIPYFVREHLSYMITAEVFALLAETVIYLFLLKVSLKRAFLLALICNTLSFLAGELIKMIM